MRRGEERRRINEEGEEEQGRRRRINEEGRTRMREGQGKEHAPSCGMKHGLPFKLYRCEYPVLAHCLHFIPKSFPVSHNVQGLLCWDMDQFVCMGKKTGRRKNGGENRGVVWIDRLGY